MAAHARYRLQNASLLLHWIIAGAFIFSTGQAMTSIALVPEGGHYGADAASAPQEEPGHILVSDQRLWGSLLQEHAEVRKSSGSGMSLAVLWGCVVAISFALAASIMYLCSAVRGQRAYEGKSSPARGMASGAAASMRSMTSLRSGSDACSDKDAFTEDESCMSSSTLQTRSRTSVGLPGLPLCHLLVVPDGTRLACFIQNEVRRRKQDLAFDVSAVPARGGAPLFRMRVSEMGPEPSRIFVETLGGREQLAELSTEEFWRGTPNPSMAISRPWGLPYGQLQKGDNGEYLMLRSQNTMLVFSGDYQSHNIQVQDTSGHTIATTMQTSPDEYQVHMQARTDAGLIILALLAIDKCELGETPIHSSRVHGEGSVHETAQQVSC